MIPRHPIYVPSKGRWQDAQAHTVKALRRDSIPFRLVVEPGQAADYRPWVTERDKLLVLPGDDFGVMNARNWIRDHAEAEGHERHWQLDDNMRRFTRVWEGRRIPCHAGVALAVAEDFAERFDNIGIAGLNYEMFVVIGAGAVKTPYFRNCHVYSCCLINHAMPYRWRLKTNEDTDLCLQALTNGWGTFALNAFSVHKQGTMQNKGGNTDDLYVAEGEQVDGTDSYGRYRMARVLERAWPGTVKIIRRFERFQHDVNWKAFRDVAWNLRVNVDALPEVDEYGLTLREVAEVKSDAIRALPGDYKRVVRAAVAPDPLWRGLPVFRPTPDPLKLAVECRTEQDRERLVELTGVTVDKRYKNKAWSAWWPPQGRHDPASLRFEVI